MWGNVSQLKHSVLKRADLRMLQGLEVHQKHRTDLTDCCVSVFV